MKKTTIVTRILFALFLAMAVFYLGYQLTVTFSPGIRTVKAQMARVDDVIEVDGYFVRDEFVFEHEKTGIYDLLRKDGEKVPRYGDLAIIYESDSDRKTSNDLQELERKIAQYRALSAETTEMVNADSVNTRIYRCIYSLAGCAVSDDYEEAAGLVEELSAQVILKEFAFSDNTFVQDKLDELEGEYAGLKVVQNKRKQVLRTPYAGYYCHKVDGYEEILTPDIILKRTPGTVLTLFQTMEPKNLESSFTYGRISRNSVWYYAAFVTEAESKGFQKGGSYQISFQNASVDNIRVKLERIEAGEGSSGVLLVFSGNDNLADTVGLRREKCKVTIRVYEGIKIPKTALRVQDGTAGVFCLSGVQAKFKPVEVLFDKDNYYICGADFTKKNALLLNEDLIVSSKDLYDGKVVE